MSSAHFVEEEGEAKRIGVTGSPQEGELHLGAAALWLPVCLSALYQEACLALKIRSEVI